MRRKLLPLAVLMLTTYMLLLLPTFTAAYGGYYWYSGKPIKYGGWLIGQVYMEIRDKVQPIPWVKITVTSANGTMTKVAYTNGYGYYRVYLPPGDYTVTASYVRYTQTSNVTIWENAEYRRLNIYIERPDMPEFQDRLAHH